MTIKITGTRKTGTQPDVEEVAVMTALRKLPPDDRLEVLRYIEYLDYKANVAHNVVAEDRALWAAVEVNQEYKSRHPDEELEVFETGADFLQATADL
jgi:hypothetical protein